MLIEKPVSSRVLQDKKLQVEPALPVEAASEEDTDSIIQNLLSRLLEEDSKANTQAALPETPLKFELPKLAPKAFALPQHDQPETADVLVKRLLQEQSIVEEKAVSASAKLPQHRSSAFGNSSRSAQNWESFAPVKLTLANFNPAIATPVMPAPNPVKAEVLPGVTLPKVETAEPLVSKELPFLNRIESFKALLVVLLAALPVLLVAGGLRLLVQGKQSPFMDETIYIITGRLLNEQNTLYSNALQWVFGSLLYPATAGMLDRSGGLGLVRLFSLFWGLVLVGSTIFMTLGLFKALPDSQSKARADFAISSKPVMAALMAGLITAILPNLIALSGFATYDAMAVGLFAAGSAVFVWAVREARIVQVVSSLEKPKMSRIAGIYGLFGLAAMLFFAAFLTKYIVAIYLPMLCLVVLIYGPSRIKGFISFVLPLGLACLYYYSTYNKDLTALLQFASQHKDLQSDDWFKIYVVNQFDLLLLLLFGYWGFRQTIRDNRAVPGLLLVIGAAVSLVFQISTRADYDYWKHSAYMVLAVAPLVGWLWADWTWWDEPTEAHSPNIRRWWANYKNKQLARVSTTPWAIEAFERSVGGTEETERDGCSYSLLGAIAGILLLIGLFWSVESAKSQLGKWPSYTPAAQAEITRFSQESLDRQNLFPQSSKVLTDDNAVLYYLYSKLPLSQVTDPFYINYQGKSGLEAYAQAVRDKQYGLIILNGGATYRGQQVNQAVRPILTEANSPYVLTYNEELNQPYLEGPHTIEIYRLATTEELKQAKAQTQQSPRPANSVVAPAPTPGTFGGPSQTATAVAGKSSTVNPTPAVTAQPSQNSVKAAPTASLSVTTVAQVTPTATATLYPAKAAYDFAKGDEGWGLQPDKSELQPGTAVASSDAYKLENHFSLKFTPQISSKSYGVGVLREGKVRKISLFVYVPADKAGGDVRMGLYYFSKDWKWNDDGFNTKVTPGQWTELKLELPEATDIKQFGLKLIGFSGSIYINGVSLSE